MPSPEKPGSAAIVYADITGFTAISEKLDPERVTEIMNRCFEALEGVVVAHGGEVNKYLGDCVVAAFGLQGDSDGSRCAVEAALEIRDAVDALNKELSLPSPLGIHIGVDSGDVDVGIVGGEVRKERTVMGQPVRVASALEDASSVGEILTGELTYTETNDEFAFSERDQVAVGGRSFKVFELLGLREALKKVKRPSERRQATVIFMGLSGFDRLPPGFTGELRRNLLNQCFARLEAIVRSQGGIIDKYIGESLLALFGVPDAIEDAPQRAVNAAVEMRNAIYEIGQEVGAPLQMKAGINSGLVIAGEIGGRIKRDYTVMGDTVNVASRLKDAARADAIVIGPSTHHATERAFEWNPLEPLALKGKSEPLPAWEVVSEQAQEMRLREQQGTVFSRLVGRDEELASLTAAVSALTSGRGSAFSVIGEAGLGKSRLLAELLASEACQSARVLEGPSSAVGQNHSYHPFIGAFRQWSAVDGEMEPEPARRRLRAAMETTLPAEAEDRLPFIATLMDIPLEGEDAERIKSIEGEALERLIFRSTRELLAAIAAEKPLMLVLDDLHWSDQTSLQLLEELLRALRHSPLLFLLVSRPGYEDTSERIHRLAREEAEVQHQELRLTALSTQHSEELIHALIPIDDLPQASRRLITSKAEGNPYYLEEVMRSLVDQGAIEVSGDGYRVTERIEDVEIPSTIQELILARVDRLDESTRYVLQLGAVIGRSFHYSLMTELLQRSGMLSEHVDTELALLKTKELLSERGAGWSVALAGGDMAQEVEYVFQHVLAQEAIYESLLQRTRLELHAAVAETIENRFGDRIADFYPMLAFHFSRADDLEKAEEYLFKAGEKAAGAAASSEALNLFREAARLYMKIHGDGGDPRKKALLEKNIGSALLTSGQLSESVEHYDRALSELGIDLGGSQARIMSRFAFDITSVLGNLFLRNGAHSKRSASDDEAESFDIMFRRFKALTTSDPQRLFLDNMGLIRRMNALDSKSVEQSSLAYCLGSAAFAYAGVSFPISRRFLERAEPLLDRGDVTQTIGYAFTRFTLNFLSGNWREEGGIDPETIEAGIRNGVFWDVNSYLGLECDRQLRMGRYDRARDLLESLTELGEDYGYEFAATNHDGMKALMLVEQRDEQALEAISSYLEGRHEEALRVLALGTRAKVHLLRSETDLAKADLDAAEEVVAKSEVTPPWHMSALTTASLRFLADELIAGRASSAPKKLLRRAVKVADRVAGARPETYRLLGHIEWAKGNAKGAGNWWERAIATSEALGTEPELVRALADSVSRWESAPSEKLQKQSAAHRERLAEIAEGVDIALYAESSSVMS